jgi:hypothetical protein
VQVLLLAAGSINAALSAMALLFFSACVAWLKSTLRLSMQMQQYAEQQAQTEAAAAAAAAQQQQAELQQQQQQQVAAVAAGPIADLERSQRQLEHWQRDWQQQRKAQRLRRRQQQQQRQQQLQQYQGWLLPLPCELAAAAAAASRWYGSEQAPYAMPGAAGSAAGSAMPAGSDVDDRSSSSSSSNASSSDGGSCPGLSSGRAAHPLLLQPPMLCDAEYWDSVYLALAADPALLEAAVIGRHSSDIQRQQAQQRAAGGAASVGAQQQQQQQQRQQGQQPQLGLAGNVLPEMRGVALAKEALHTTFDVY